MRGEILFLLQTYTDRITHSSTKNMPDTWILFDTTFSSRSKERKTSVKELEDVLGAQISFAKLVHLSIVPEIILKIWENLIQKRLCNISCNGHGGNFKRDKKYCESNKICAMESLCININDEFVPQLVRYIPFCHKIQLNLKTLFATRL